MNISKFTQKSQEVVQSCEKIAMDHGHQEIGEEHLLSAMMTVEESLIRKLIEKMGIPTADLWTLLQQSFQLCLKNFRGNPHLFY